MLKTHKHNKIHVTKNILPLQNVIWKTLLWANYYFGNVFATTECRKESLQINKLKKHLSSLHSDIIENSYININSLNQCGLRLNELGIDKPAINFINKTKDWRLRASTIFQTYILIFALVALLTRLKLKEMQILIKSFQSNKNLYLKMLFLTKSICMSSTRNCSTSKILKS